MTLYADLQAILACAQVELVDAGRTVPDEVFVAPGGPAFETHCGQLWARVIRSFPTVDFPNQTGPQVWNCGDEVATEIGLGITRCQTGVWRLEDGGHPTPAEQNADASGLICDQGALYRALVCCFSTKENPVAVNEWTQLEPQGAVVGGEWTGFVTSSLYCEAESPPDSPGDSP